MKFSGNPSHLPTEKKKIHKKLALKIMKKQKKNGKWSHGRNLEEGDQHLQIEAQIIFILKALVNCHRRGGRTLSYF